MKELTFLDVLLGSQRRILKTTMFNISMRTSLLNFIGAPNYFITECGLIWNRDKIYLNKFQLLTRYYLPYQIRDEKYPYPWTMIPTVHGTIWFPVNQLLGWGFNECPKDKKYFICDQPELFPYDLNRFRWVDSLDEEDEDSPYINFMKGIYLPKENPS